jgi:hypothetical protein
MNKKERLEANIRQGVTKYIAPLLFDPDFTLASATEAIEGALAEWAKLNDEATPDDIEMLRSILLDDLHRRLT